MSGEAIDEIDPGMLIEAIGFEEVAGGVGIDRVIYAGLADAIEEAAAAPGFVDRGLARMTEEIGIDRVLAHAMRIIRDAGLARIVEQLGPERVIHELVEHFGPQRVIHELVEHFGIQRVLQECGLDRPPGC